MKRTEHPFLASLRSGHAGKVVSSTDAVRLIHDGDTVATGGFVGIGFAEGIAVALEELFLSGEAAHGHSVGPGAMNSLRRIIRSPRRRAAKSIAAPSDQAS
jgi:propionate CoA-transferase